MELGSYVLLRTLSPNKSYLAAGPGGRQVVLKLLQADCLLRGALHPSIRERLARVRELPERAVANLHGVEKDRGHAYLIWDFVPGVPLVEYAADPSRSPRDVARVARDLVLAVESLHAAGIVHGAVRSDNVIVTPLHEVRLTHVSPLLHSDPARDVSATLDLLAAAAAAGPRPDAALGRLLDDARAGGFPLRGLGTRLGAPRQPACDADAGDASCGGARVAASPGPALHAGARRQDAAVGSPAREPDFRRRARVAAVLAVLAGAAVAAGVWRHKRDRPDDPYAPRGAVGSPARPEAIVGAWREGGPARRRAVPGPRFTVDAPPPPPPGRPPGTIPVSA